MWSLRRWPPTMSVSTGVGGNEFSAVQGDGDFTQLEGSYDNILPNIDFRLGVTDDIVARLSFSKTMTRPKLRRHSGWPDD